jgi:hypothetical protein
VGKTVKKRNGKAYPDKIEAWLASNSARTKLEELYGFWKSPFSKKMASIYV